MTADDSVPAVIPARFTPTAEPERIAAIDAVRGLALLGIFLVNIQSFGQPLAGMSLSAPPAGSAWSEIGAFYFVKIFCESKSYPLFAMLFGAGLVLQASRADEAGRRFRGPGLRRMLVLLLMGAAHALFLWYGDILFMYAVIGFVLLFFARSRARTLAIVGFICAIVAIAATSILTVFVIAAPETSKPIMSPPAPTHFENPFETWATALGEGKLQDPESQLWVNTETQAYREGPYDQLFKFRAATWLLILAFAAAGYGWHIAAMVFFGAALFKAGIFDPAKRRWQRRLLGIGVFFGLPLSAIAPFCRLWWPGARGDVIGEILVFVGGPFLSLGYLSAITLLVENSRLPVLMRGLTSAGRMALTNYLMQSVIATTIFYYYGLGLFGQTTEVERIRIVFVVYFLQLLLSVFWLRVFRFGPMEWLWRSLTYLRLQPLLR